MGTASSGVGSLAFSGGIGVKVGVGGGGTGVGVGNISMVIGGRAVTVGIVGEGWAGALQLAAKAKSTKSNGTRFIIFLLRAFSNAPRRR